MDKHGRGVQPSGFSMSARPELHAFFLLVLLALGACSDSGPVSGVGDDDDGADEGPYLENEGDEVVRLLPNGMTELSVRYIDAFGSALPGVPIEFAVTDPAGGSSLMPSMPVTDDEGRATTLLRVGSDPTTRSFDARVSADGVEPLFIEVRVGEVAGVAVVVEVAYQGARDVQKRTVTALPSVTCSEALAAGVSGELTYTFEGEETVKEFQLGPGLHYSVLAWGRDRTNAKVAEGCTEVDAPIKDELDPLELEVMLVDTPMKLQGSYALTLDLDVSESVARVSGAIEAAVSEALPTTDAAEGDFFLDALESTLRGAGNTAAADELAARRTGEGLAGALQSSLDAAQHGVLAYATALAEAAATFGNRLEARTTYGNSEMGMQVTVDMLRARTTDGTDGLDLGGLITEGMARIEAQYSDTLGALDIATLSLKLGLGSYGKALVAAIATRGEPGPRKEAGCEQLAAFVAADGALALACDASCAELACTSALDSVRAASSSALTPLDTAHDTIGLRGKVFAHERDGDGIVNDLGPATLMGHWGKSDDADEVQGSVPAPVTSSVKR
jgi:hypothetical protein